MPKKRRDLSASYEITGDLVGRWYKGEIVPADQFVSPEEIDRLVGLGVIVGVGEPPAPIEEPAPEEPAPET